MGSFGIASCFESGEIYTELCCKFCRKFWIYFSRLLRGSGLLCSCFLNWLLFLSWLCIWIERN